MSNIEEILESCEQDYSHNYGTIYDIPKLLDEVQNLITKSNEEAIRGFEESVFFGDTIMVDGKTYVSVEHIQKVKEQYLTKKEEDDSFMYQVDGTMSPEDH